MMLVEVSDFVGFTHSFCFADMESDLEAIVRFLVSKRWPFRLHATYGESIERELAVFEKIEKDTPGSFKNLRWFIDHAETVSERDIVRIHALGGGIAIQHRMAFQGEYFVQRYGSAEAEFAPPIAAMRKAGVHIGAGTDGTRVATYNPWVSLQWLVTGQTVGGLQMYGKDNLTDRLEALRLWTDHNAWFCNAESKQGSLTPGKFADLAVLSHDYFSVAPDAIGAIESVLTIVGGQVVYTDGPFRGKVPEASLQVALNPSWSPVNFFGGYQLPHSSAWPLTKHEVTDTGAKVFSAVASGAATAPPAGSGADDKGGPSPVDFFMHGSDC